MLRIAQATSIGQLGASSPSRHRCFRPINRKMSPDALSENAPRTADETRWTDEIARLEDVIAYHERERRALLWFLKIGAVLFIPSLFVHKLAPFAVALFALSGFFCGNYFVRGHLAEQHFKLDLARKQLRIARDAARAPEPPA